MPETFIIADNIISPLGFDTRENMQAIHQGDTGIKQINDRDQFPNGLCAALMDTTVLNNRFSAMADPPAFTRFEKMALLSADDAINQSGIDPARRDTLFILATTKGSIDVIEDAHKNRFDKDRLYLWKAAEILSKQFNNPNKPLVISNACISGVLAIILGKRLIDAGHYAQVVVCGADIITRFVASGFQSFQALSDEVCRPFDKDRKGLNIGEAAGTVVLSSNPDTAAADGSILVGRGFSSNDANHISAPSRTGEGLFQVIEKTLQANASHYAGSLPDFISAHGTATLYNDEMEATAINRAGLASAPVNSFKAYWGHALGAAGLIESIASAHSLKNQILLQSAGFHEKGTTHPLNIIQQTRKQQIKSCLKLASGFGGCNAGLSLFTHEA